MTTLHPALFFLLLILGYVLAGVLTAGLIWLAYFIKTFFKHVKNGVPLTEYDIKRAIPYYDQGQQVAGEGKFNFFATVFFGPVALVFMIVFLWIPIVWDSFIVMWKIIQRFFPWFSMGKAVQMMNSIIVKKAT